MPLTAVLRDLNKLNTFVRVAQRRSFTKAAAELRTTPSVVSKRMKELEESLGFSVLNRSTHGLALTEAGRGLFRQCLEILAKLDNYVTERRNIETGPFGTLRVQATSDYSRFILAPLTRRFVEQHPGVRVHLSVVPDNFISAESGFDIDSVYDLERDYPRFGQGVLIHIFGVDADKLGDPRDPQVRPVADQKSHAEGGGKSHR